MIANIFEIKRFAVHDGNGIRTTVFFKGCPLRCVWCHNPEGILKKTQEAFFEHKCIGCKECLNEGFLMENCPAEARILYGREISVDELLPILLEDRDFYESSNGGVTLSGGECLLQADFCAEILKQLKKQGIHTAVDTCGFCEKEDLEKVLPFTDVFLYDIKAYDEDVHISCTGRSNTCILENLRYLDSLGVQIEIRIPLVPDFNDSQIEKIAVLLSTLKNVSGVRILPYHNYAGSKYVALGMENKLPSRLPTEAEIFRAKQKVREISGLRVIT